MILFKKFKILGATPYSDVSTKKDLQMRVMRGMRLKQPKYVSDDLYQLLLACWQIDLDERPTFQEMVDYLTNIMQAQVPLDFNITPGFSYEPHLPDLELQPV